jgi:hypothetical protein
MCPNPLRHACHNDSQPWDNGRFLLEIKGKTGAAWAGTRRALLEEVMRRTGIYLLVILSIAVGAALVADAIVVTDRERMDEFIDSVTGQVSESRIDNALRYADPSKFTMELVHDGHRRRYSNGNAAALKPDARKALASLEGSRLHLIQESISLDGEHARIALRLRTDAGLANTIFDLRREKDQWILRRVIVN